MIAGITASILGVAGGPTDTGWVTCGTGTDGGFGDAAWSNESNITAVDTNYATCSPGARDQCNLLQGTNYSFAIPGGATILGIETRINTSETGGVDMIVDVVQIMKAGSTTGTAKNVSDDITGSFEDIDHGSSSDLWGTTFTPSDINNSGFGVSHQLLDDGAGSDTVSVNYTQIKVHYST